MITAKLSGGIGNLLFEIAATIALARRNNSDAVFDLDAHQIDNQGCVATKYKDTILKNLKTAIIPFQDWGHQYEEPEFKYNELPFIEPQVINGYFQSERYFEDQKEYIKALFQFPYETRLRVTDFIGKTFETAGEDRVREITTIHVRMGDYVSKFSHIYHQCSMRYYQEAMSMFPDSDFLFVSDDMQWVKENFQGSNVFYSPFTDELDDMCLLSSGDNIIMANSSFSWWSAYLSHAEKVVAPKDWFKPDVKHDTSDLYLKEWIKI